MVQRIIHLGFEVRVDLMLADGRHIWAQITRDDVEQLDLTQGQIVYVRPSREKRFAPVSRTRMLFGNAG
jgi:sulfate transport system ATP-binding protein